MADNDIQIRVKVDAQGAITVLDKLGNEIRTVDRAAQETGRGFDFFSNKIVVLNQGLELVSKGFRAVSDGVQKLADLAALGDQVNDVGGAFSTLSMQAGAVGDVFLGKLREATQDSISNLGLMKLANDAMVAGLDPAQFTKVAAAAKEYGDTIALDTTEAINKLSEAVQTGNERTLKQFGIYSDGKERVKDYTEEMSKLGLQVDAQTIAEIKQTAALDALNKKQIETAKGVKGVADTLDTVKTAYGNLIERTGAAFDANTELAKSLGELKKAFDKIDGAKFGASLATIGKLLATLGNTIIPTVVDEINNFARGLDVLFSTSKEASAARLHGRIDDIRKEIDYLNNTSHNNTWADKFFGTDSRTKIEELNTELDITQRTYDGLIKELQEGKAVEDAATKAAGEMAAEIKRLKDEFAGAEAGARNFNAAIKKIETPQILDAYFVDDPGTDGESLFESKGGLIATSILDGFQSAMNSSGKDRTKSIVSSLGTTIGAAFGGQEGAQIGKFATDAAITIVDAFHNAFGGDSEGTKMKKAADKFFAEAFEANRLSIVVNGELEKISDLVFSGNQEGGLFAGLPAATQQAFNGVGVAFEGLLDIAGDLGVNIGNVLANNVGGSLNNLQLLVQATGTSFATLGEQVVTTFLNGELSVKQANDALKSIEQIAQKGIPDGLGLIADGFANMQAAGTKGGRAVVDGLQDIGFEAKELGFTTFPEIIKHLEESGRFSSDAIQETFAALEANGIKTIDQLTAATAAELLPALAQLEESGVLTEALEKTAELARSINELPSEKTIVLNVKANVTPEAGAVISAVRTGQANGTPYNQ